MGKGHPSYRHPPQIKTIKTIKSTLIADLNQQKDHWNATRFVFGQVKSICMCSVVHVVSPTHFITLDKHSCNTWLAFS